MTQQKSSKLGLGIIVGAVAGAVAGLFLAPKAGKELRKDAQKLYSDITKDSEAAVKEIFGKVTEESMDLYKKAQKEVASQVDNASKTYKSIDKAKYKEIVMNAVENVKEDMKLPETQLKKLMSYLEGDFKKLANNVAPKKKAAAKKKA